MSSETHVRGGHIANLHNPNTSNEAKEHSKEILKDEHNIIVDGSQVKNAERVAAGLKGAMHNPRVPEKTQFADAEKLGEIQK